jgi:hypothetical protein
LVHFLALAFTLNNLRTPASGFGGVHIEAAGEQSVLGIGYDGTAQVFAFDTSYRGTGAFRPIAFKTSNQERLRITSAGLVGIGTSTIRGTSLLDARGDISFGSNVNYYGLLSYNAGTGQFEATSSDGGFKWIRASGPTTSMTLDSSGRLGIGTTSPGAELDVRGGANVGDGTTTVRTVASGGVGFVGTSTNHPLSFRINNGEAARIDTSGSLLVGTSSASKNADRLTGNKIALVGVGSAQFPSHVITWLHWATAMLTLVHVYSITEKQRCNMTVR